VREIAKAINPYISKQTIIVNTAKGFEPLTLKKTFSGFARRTSFILSQ
jgi:glycerol-3-phosphate dehydrogenase